MLANEALEPFRAVVSELFLQPANGAEPDLVFEVSVARTDLTTIVLNMPFASVTAHVAVKAGNQVIDRLHLTGSAMIRARDQQSVGNALSNSVADVAQDFKRAFPDSEPVVRWLLARKIEPVGSTILGPGRGSLVFFLDAGGGLVHRTDGLGPAFAGRAGLSGKWFMVRGTFETWTAPREQSSSVDASAFGLQLGPVLRLGRNWELQAGAGLHSVSGTITDLPGAPTTADFSRTLPSVFLGFQYARWLKTKSSSRLRVGFELRHYFDHDMPVDQIHQVVDIADTAAFLTLGIEFGIVESGAPALVHQ